MNIPQHVHRQYESKFPNLAQEGWQPTSLNSDDYNCIAWASGNEKQWWWHENRGGGAYWPSNIPRDGSVASYAKLFEEQGYSMCDNPHKENGYEKVAIYANYLGRVTHAARQLESGIWTSKLGHGHDIAHNTVDALDGMEYGQVVMFLKRLIGRQQATKHQDKKTQKRK